MSQITYNPTTNLVNFCDERTEIPFVIENDDDWATWASSESCACVDQEGEIFVKVYNNKTGDYSDALNLEQANAFLQELESEDEE